jgi:DnaJ-domain-containing protein 1
LRFFLFFPVKYIGGDDMDIILIFVAFAVISVLGTLIRYFANYVNRKKNGTTAESFGPKKGGYSTSQINKAFLSYNNAFLTEDNKDVPIKGFNVRVRINKQPFNSDFSDIKAQFNATTAQFVVEESHKYQNLFKEYANALMQLAGTERFEYNTNDEIAEDMANLLDSAYLHYLSSFIGEAVPEILKTGTDTGAAVATALEDFNNAVAADYRELLAAKEVAQQNTGFFGRQGAWGFGGQQASQPVQEWTQLDKAYGTMGLNRNATDDEIKKKYRELAKKFHPDRNKDPKAKEIMAGINEAYTLIREERGF